MVLTDIPFQFDYNRFSQKTQLGKFNDYRLEAEKFIKQILPHVHPKAGFTEHFVQARRNNEVTIGGITFSSKILSENVAEVERVFPYVATCGREVYNFSYDSSDMLIAYWHDVIQEMALETAFKTLKTYISKTYAIPKLSSMSPGSGNINIWPISEQQKLFRLLQNDAETIGVELTKSYLMIPNKSVSGIYFPSEVDFITCRICRRKNCPKRRALFTG